MMLSLALSYVLKPNEVQGFNPDVADVNGNAVIDSVDVALILQKALDSSFKFPIERCAYSNKCYKLEGI